MLRILTLLFAIVILSSIIMVNPKITSVAASPESAFSTSSINSSLSQEESRSAFKITDDLKNLLRGIVDSNRTNAAFIVGIVDPNGTQFYGNGKMSNTSDATVDQDTIFGLGSLTKVFTATLLASMVEDGLIKLDDPIEKYLPSNVTAPSYNGHKITLEDLATHTAGFPEFPDNYCPAVAEENPQTPSERIQFQSDLADCAKNYTFDDLFQGLSNTTITREPSTKVEYSTFGSALLGNILIQKSNVSSYEELVEKRIFEVLGMNDTSINLSEDQKSRLAVGHLYGQELALFNYSNPIAPGGGLYSSASDMLKFISANIGLMKTKLDSPMQETHLIRHSTGLVLPNNLVASDNAENIGFYIGLGWFATTDFGSEIIWHNGATNGGYNSIMAFNPVTERGIVILCSSDLTNANITTAGWHNNNPLSSLVWDLLTR